MGRYQKGEIVQIIPNKENIEYFEYYHYPQKSFIPGYFYEIVESKPGFITAEMNGITTEFYDTRVQSIREILKGIK